MSNSNPNKTDDKPYAVLSLLADEIEWRLTEEDLPASAQIEILNLLKDWIDVEIMTLKDQMGDRQ